jgi:hypothetical protein
VLAKDRRDELCLEPVFEEDCIAEREAGKWSKIAKLEEIMEKEDQQRKKAAESQKKVEYRNYLTQQALDHKNKIQEARDADRALDRIQSLANRQRMENDEVAKKQKQEEIKVQQKEILDSQMQFNRVLRQTEKQETLAFGRHYAEKCLRELEREQEAQTKKRDEIREEGMRWAEEIEEQRAQKYNQKCTAREDLRKWAFETYREEREEQEEMKRAKEASRKTMEERALLVPVGGGAAGDGHGGLQADSARSCERRYCGACDVVDDGSVVAHRPGVQHHGHSSPACGCRGGLF